MHIEWTWNGTRASRSKWRNLATGECRLTPPELGELDWVENASTVLCPD
jgi:hypothetical protein